MRAALVLALVAAGCGGSGASDSDVLSASFASLAGANTSGVAISTPYAACFIVGGASFNCVGTENANGSGRKVTVAIDGVPVAGMDYAVGTHATVLFEDPTTLGTASGQRDWQSVPGTGTVHIVDFATDRSHVSFTYAASMRALASPATGTFDLNGAGNIAHISATP